MKKKLQNAKPTHVVTKNNMSVQAATNESLIEKKMGTKVENQNGFIRSQGTTMYEVSGHRRRALRI